VRQGAGVGLVVVKIPRASVDAGLNSSGEVPGGTLVRKQLDGQTLRVDTGCLVAFTRGIDDDIEPVSGLTSMLFGGEGLCLTTLSGRGSLWLQSLPFSRLADRILANAPARGGRDKGES